MFNSIHVCSTWLNSLLIDWISASCKCVERLLGLVVPPMQQEQREIKANLYSLHHQDSITQLYNNNNTHTASPSLCGLLRAVIICAIVFYYSPQTPASLRNPSIIQWFRSRANKSSFSFKDFSISLFCPPPVNNLMPIQTRRGAQVWNAQINSSVCWDYSESIRKIERRKEKGKKVVNDDPRIFDWVVVLCTFIVRTCWCSTD
jgi:hypothetical protein